MKYKNEIAELRKERLLNEINSLFKVKINSVYNLISGKESSRELKDFYSSKLWAAQIISERDVSGNAQIALKRGLTDTELMNQAEKELTIAYTLHKKEKTASNQTPKSSLIEYAIFICEVANFWKKAEGSLTVAVGTVMNKLIEMTERAAYDQVENLIVAIEGLAVAESATTLDEKVDSILLQIETIIVL